MTTHTTYDVVVVGAGHNGLVAAARLARAGQSVLVLERAGQVGGAAVSAQAFAGVPARLSRYSYLVSLMPQALIEELDLPIRLASRAVASYTPVPGGPGLLVERAEGEATRASFRTLTGSDDEYDAWRDFYSRADTLCRAIAPTLMEPLPREQVLRAQVDAQVWRDFVTTAIGHAIERTFDDDTVRGVVATDALIGTFASLADPSLIQNRCLLYHLVGGEWRVPIGGMGAVTDALLAAASNPGAQILTGAEVERIESGAAGSEVTWRGESGPQRAECRLVLAGVAPWVLDRLIGAEPGPKPEGCQVKVNLLLDRLPTLRSGVDPEVAFAGTLHLAEGWQALQRAYDEAAAGRLPTELPGEIYCHTLTDPSILGGRAGHTLTYFGLHAPASLFEPEPEAHRAEVLARVLASINEHLTEPIEDCLARDGHGRPCVEVKLPQDVEADLAMPGGHIFHGDLQWPWAPDEAALDTPARRWGVESRVPGVLLCGSGARRGGAVSGLGGHNASAAALELLE
ncbi:phytoene desaturase family protein [Nocardioides limicola]|uniref:phytoene desaturase family protein n=1 Tax=Nocardioides limicola TaxID=2803368 RepID=UPI0027DCA260|nr:NAD(P)/FAD-dependent oxidoreductase [Nocardioides sp. DJM-14]